VATWGKPGFLDGKNPPPYKATEHENPEVGQKAYDTYCARCHGTDGQGNLTAGKPASEPAVGSIVDPAYLGLISDQNLRSIVIAGAEGMPDWRGEGHGPSPGRAMTDEEVTSVVGWLGSHRQSVHSPAVTTGSTSMSSPEKSAEDSGTKRQEPHS
jgi:mono/diheme cytochrome c family protein